MSQAPGQALATVTPQAAPSRQGVGISGQATEGPFSPAEALWYALALQRITENTSAALAYDRALGLLEKQFPGTGQAVRSAAEANGGHFTRAHYEQVSRVFGGETAPHLVCEFWHLPHHHRYDHEPAAPSTLNDEAAHPKAGKHDVGGFHAAIVGATGAGS